MRKLLGLCLCAGLLAVTANAEELELLIPVRSKAELSSKTMQEGQILDFEVAEDVQYPGDQLFIKKGTPAKAMAFEVIPGARMMKTGKLKIELLSTSTVSGEKVKLKGYASEFPQNKHDNLICPSVICAMRKGKEAIITPDKTYFVLLESERKYFNAD